MPKPTTLPGDLIGRNLSVTRDGNIVSLHFDASAEPVQNPKTLKWTIATSKGFTTAAGVGVSVNVIPVG
jgi:hypothetical protein